MLHKPKHCGQNWLDMCPTHGGRICEACQKVIIDFSKKSWKEIEEIQANNNNAVCGMYSNRQLDNWGQEVKQNKMAKTLSAVALISAMSTGPLLSQDTPARTKIYGTTTILFNEGMVDTLSFASVLLKSTNHGTVSDAQGKYEIDLTGYVDTIDNPTLIYSYTGYNNLEVSLGKTNPGSIKIDAQFEESVDMSIVYYVRRPTFGERMNAKIKNWFKKK